jgi:GNAT superfamily N-acetyltransferase
MAQQRTPRGRRRAFVVPTEGEAKGMVDVRELVETCGINALTIDDLQIADLPLITWSGNPAHIRSVAEKLLAVETGQADYLAVRAPDGSPIAKCVIEYSPSESSAEIAQLAVRDDLQGIGVGTLLIRSAEQRIQVRGVRWAILGVEAGDERPRCLYERLGYQLFGREDASWEVEGEDGRVWMHETEVLMLRREVGAHPSISLKRRK